MPDRIDQQKNAYLGQGIAFPLRVTVQGSLQLSATARNIEESILIILRTNLGERIYRPNFGSRLSELVFAPMNIQTLLLIRLYVEEALEMWEPRIVLDAVRTDPDPVRGLVNVTIEYHPKDSHDKRSLVYPFYLLPQSESLA
ncbi:MAG: GPW/gp25 family protein [Symplocastrum torsivum CPER-KK1]|jgi:phage baseplate assembly protein W|uniref:GPW/gp25 family protein n=1 Tax=Symplocastrum torsivum CPER-KK1 TaxID=450513 RepID=A0A951UC94_9CYAN|nr:GPW/gp25 family protein [Microcoleus sp. FACHB-SPT15]MBD1806692.1 GPW/gp25 family protein [Microcoleus sp. FACHB-SPT15]MBW4546421.1 GPW/gp25 family protein [Symplocastrum torsivum CPER-KK1]